MNKWTRADNYMGESYDEYFVLLTQTRDSNIIKQSNFAVALTQLGGESETGLVVRNGHWLCGWLEFIAIHESNSEAIAIGNGIETRIKSYLILDEFDYDGRVLDFQEDTWETCAGIDFSSAIRDGFDDDELVELTGISNLEQAAQVFDDFVDQLDDAATGLRELYDILGGTIEHDGDYNIPDVNVCDILDDVREYSKSRTEARGGISW